MRTCSAESSPRANAAAVAGYCGSSGSPAIDRRGPNSSPSVSRRQASVFEMRNRMDSTSAQLRMPSSAGLDCAFTAAMTRC
jgi:hypothetical protein